MVPARPRIAAGADATAIELAAEQLARGDT
jgi:hypothetical protein